MSQNECVENISIEFTPVVTPNGDNLNISNLSNISSKKDKIDIYSGKLNSFQPYNNDTIYHDEKGDIMVPISHDSIIFCYDKKTETMTCMSKNELISLIKNEDYVNPYTNTKFSDKIIKRVVTRYIK